MIRIDELPDDTLLYISDKYHDSIIEPNRGSMYGNRWFMCVENGKALCLPWVTTSPEYTALYTPNLTTPAKDTLDVWPALPLLVEGDSSMAFTSGMDKIVVALEDRNHVQEINLRVGNGKSGPKVSRDCPARARGRQSNRSATQAAECVRVRGKAHLFLSIYWMSR